MKTAEEILNDRVLHRFVTTTFPEATKENVLLAMEEYASEAIREKDNQLAAKDKEIEQLREALATVTKEQLQATVKAQLSGKTEPFTGPVVGIEDETEFKNAR